MRIPAQKLADTCSLAPKEPRGDHPLFALVNRTGAVELVLTGEGVLIQLSAQLLSEMQSELSRPGSVPGDGRHASLFGRLADFDRSRPDHFYPMEPRRIERTLADIAAVDYDENAGALVFYCQDAAAARR